MSPEDPPPRIPEVPADGLTPEMRAFLGRWTGGIFKDADRNPVLLTFARHVPLADAFSQFNIHLLSGSTLPVRQRQIAIMRTAWLCGATYMWSSHLRTSLRCGLEPELFRPLQAGADDPYFTPFERDILRATEQLVAQRTLDEAHWQALRAQWNEQQLLDFLFTVGCYVTTAMVMNAVGIQRLPELRELAGRYGAP